MYFPNYGLRKNLLDECLKNIVVSFTAMSNLITVC